MSRRGEEEEAAGLFRMANAEGRSNRAAEGMSDDDRLLYAALHHEVRDGVRLAGWKHVFRAATLGIAMTRPVDEQHFRAAGERRKKGSTLVEQVTAGAVDEDKSGKVGGLWAWNMNGIHAVAADVGQFSDIGMCLLDLVRHIGGVTDGGCKGCEEH
jgi:hypothetical protein